MKTKTRKLKSVVEDAVIRAGRTPQARRRAYMRKYMKARRAAAAALRPPKPPRTPKARYMRQYMRKRRQEIVKLVPTEI